jgi:ATPase subunit of ABC transporter with duplicated ATPase domains
MENLENVVETTETTTPETVETTDNVVVTGNAIDDALALVRKAGRPKCAEKSPEEIEAAQEAKAERDAAREEKKAARAAKKAEKDAARAEKRKAKAAKAAAKAEERAAAKEQRKAERESKRPFQVGQAVKVVSGEFAGIQGLVAKCARKRVFIAVQGQKKQAYCLIEEVAAL